MSYNKQHFKFDIMLKKLLNLRQDNIKAIIAVCFYI
jgi:hypothetical protein